MKFFWEEGPKVILVVSGIVYLALNTALFIAVRRLRPKKSEKRVDASRSTS